MGVPPARKLGHNDPLRIAVADDSSLVYSDDYRDGWPWGFERIGCEVRVFDIAALRHCVSGGPYRARIMPGMPKMLGQEIASWRPDLVFVHHGRAGCNQSFLQPLKNQGIVTAVYLCDEPYEVGETARYSPVFDFVFTMDPCTIQAHQQSRNDRTQRVFYLPVAVNSSRFHVNEKIARDTPIFFLGNMSVEPRAKWLKPVEDMVDGADLRYWPQAIRGGTLAVQKGSPKWISAENHAELFSKAKIGLNVSRDPSMTIDCWLTRIRNRSPNLSVPNGVKLVSAAPEHYGTGYWNDANLPSAHVNPRFMEMSACGTMVISDDTRTELTRLFPMAPRASSPEQFLEFCFYYLKHPDEAHDIGRACSSLISRRHTYRHRAAEILIRVGLKGSIEESLVGSLGEQADWLTPQDFNERGEISCWEQIGPSEPWSPAYGKSLISTCGNVREATSLNAPPPWSL